MLLKGKGPRGELLGSLREPWGVAGNLREPCGVAGKTRSIGVYLVTYPLETTPTSQLMTLESTPPPRRSVERLTSLWFGFKEPATQPN